MLTKSRDYEITTIIYSITEKGYAIVLLHIGGVTFRIVSTL